MKLKMILMAMALFAVASVSQAQFNAILLNFTPLTDQCDFGGNCLSHGCDAVIYWDANANGPDELDSPVAVGAGFGQANFNTIDMGTGEDLLGLCGGFATDPAFTISTTTPQPSLYYVVVECGGVRWTSAVFTVLNGLNEYEVGGWQCVPVGPTCNEPTEVLITTAGGRDFPVPYYQCIGMCENAPVTICLGPLREIERPHARLFEGCSPTNSGCDVDCPGAQYLYDDASWVYNPSTEQWCNVITPLSEGCVCFCLDYIEGVVDVNLTAEARDHSVEVAWTVGAGADVASYEVLRRMVGHEFESLTTVDATNVTSYTYVDAGAVNGTSYEYTLNLIDANSNVTELGTIVSATPSASAAVITEYALHQNYPNPFNPSTNLVYDVVAENHVDLTVYNAMGQEVATLVNGTVGAGRHTVSFDASNLTSGLYFYTVKIGNEFTATKKMLLVK
ncbi:MAG: T9SS type A sorting domain-containing protein [Calditrichaeota bacterium]|nr:T9SS type A sorting domain-containing protein [Calditrichota bacterium]